MEKISAQAHGRNSIRRNEAWWAKRAYDHNYRRFAGEFLDRQIMGLLSTSEQSVVRFIFDRTVAWCKDWEDICTAQFTEGAQRSDGSFAYRGTGLSKRAVQVTLKGLVKDGLVLRRDAQPRPGRRAGWQAYMLLEVWKFAELPRFAGVNIRFSAPYDKAGEVEICTPVGVQNMHPTGAESAPLNIRQTNRCKKQSSTAGDGASRAASIPTEQEPIGRVGVLDEDVLAAALPKARRAAAAKATLPLLNERAVASAKRGHAASPQGIAAAWRSTCPAAPGPAGRTMGRLKAIAALPLPDARVSWVDVAAWAARAWGVAVTLAVPFMVKDTDKREAVLHALPQLGLFAAYPDHFAHAYVRLHHGEGFRPDLIGGAKAAQRAHDKWMKRLRIAGQRGYDALPVALQTAGEVLAQATPDDPAVERAMAERQVLQAIARATRGDGPAREARADQAVRTERVRLRVIEGAGAREAMAQELGLPTYSENPDDYYNEGF